MTETLKAIRRILKCEGFAQIIVNGSAWELDLDPYDRALQVTAPDFETACESMEDLADLLAGAPVTIPEA